MRVEAVDGDFEARCATPAAKSGARFTDTLERARPHAEVS